MGEVAVAVAVAVQLVEAVPHVLTARLASDDAVASQSLQSRMAALGRVSAGLCSRCRLSTKCRRNYTVVLFCGTTMAA